MAGGQWVDVQTEAGTVERGRVLAATFGRDDSVLVEFADRTSAWFAAWRVTSTKGS